MKKYFRIFYLFILCSGFVEAQQSTGINIKMGTLIPTINFSDLYKTGFGGTISGLFEFNKEIRFTLSAGYMVWRFDNRAFNLKYAENTGYQSFDLDAPVNVVPLLVGIRYTVGNSKIKPYLSLELGFYFYSQKLSGSYVYNSATVPAPALSESGFKGMGTFGVGFTYPISQVVFLDAAGNFGLLSNPNAVSSVDNSSQFGRSSKTLYYISFMAGIDYYFN